MHIIHYFAPKSKLGFDSASILMPVEHDAKKVIIKKILTNQNAFIQKPFLIDIFVSQLL